MGSSAGSVMAAAIASYKYADLWKFFSKDESMLEKELAKKNFNSIFDAVNLLIKGAPLFDVN